MLMVGFIRGKRKHEFSLAAHHQLTPISHNTESAELKTRRIGEIRLGRVSGFGRFRAAEAHS